MTSTATHNTEHIEFIDPDRLADGQWCHRTQKTIGQGDICAAYSADRIGMGKPIRMPFRWRGALWCTASLSWLKGHATAEAYRLVHPTAFAVTPVSYGERVRDGDAARADPCGFYHGMAVTHGGATFVLCGPPVLFREGEPEQPDLFG